METRDQILEVAQELVTTVGANAMSYQHIADAIGIRKPSIHHYFPTKDALIEALIERYSVHFFELVDGILASKKNGAGKLREFIGLFEGTLKQGAHEQCCAMGMLGAEVLTLNEAAAASVRQFFVHSEKRVTAILEAGRRDGSLRFEGTAEHLAGMILAMLEGELLIARTRKQPGHFRTATDPLFRLIEN
jgi:TetR/AcrR family transcriptional repressor of nem operon